jgi:Protein of unknown function (DUF2933)
MQGFAMTHIAPHEQAGGFLSSRWGIGLLVFLAIAGFYLVTEHQAHLLGYLPLLLVLACPLMHVFMHRHHGNHGGHRDPSSANRPPGVRAER